MSLAFLLLCSLAPVLQGESIGARVEDLLLDLEDPLLAHGARIELLALGERAAWEIADRCISPPRHSGDRPARCWQPILQAMGLRAKPALDYAIVVALDQSVDYTRQGRALNLVEALALTVPAPVQTFARVPETERLVARLALRPPAPPAALAAALSGDDPCALAAALEVLALRGATAARHAPRVAELWEARETFPANLEPHRSQLVDLLAEALIAIQPSYTGIAAAYARVLGQDRPAPQKIEFIAAIAGLGPQAVDAMPALVDALLDFDDRVCRAALEAITRLGAVAVAALPAVEDCIARVADPETQHLARVARRRLSTQRDPKGRIEDLIADLVHPRRWKAAALELGALGAPAAEALLEYAETVGSRHAGSVVRDILRGLGPALGEALVRRMPAIPAGGRSMAMDGALVRLTVIVDLAVDAGIAPLVRARLVAAFREDVPSCRAAYARLVGRLDILERLWMDGGEAALELALRGGSAAEAASAARMLRRRAFASRAQIEALADVCARDRSTFPWRDDAEIEQDAADPNRDAARALVELAGTDPIAIHAYEELLGDWHVGLGVELLERLAACEAFAADAGRIAASVLHRGDDQLVLAAADTLARLGPAARRAETSLLPIAAQRVNRVTARAAQRALAAIRGQGR